MQRISRRFQWLAPGAWGPDVRLACTTFARFSAQPDASTPSCAAGPDHGRSRIRMPSIQACCAWVPCVHSAPMSAAMMRPSAWACSWGSSSQSKLPAPHAWTRSCSTHTSSTTQAASGSAAAAVAAAHAAPILFPRTMPPPSSPSPGTSNMHMHATPQPPTSPASTSTPTPSPLSPVQSTHIPRVHARHLQAWVENPTPQNVTAFAALLLEQLPARTAAHLAQLHAIVGLPPPDHSSSSSGSSGSSTTAAPSSQPVHHSGPVCHLGHSLDEMLQDAVAAAAARKHAALQEFLSDCGPQPGPPMSDQDTLGSPDSAALRVADAVHVLRQEVEVEVTRLSCELQRLTEAEAWWGDAGRVGRLDDAMEEHVAYTLALRVLLSEYTAIWCRARRAAGFPDMGLRHEAGQQRCKWSMAGPSGPPGHDSDAAAARSLLTPHAPLLQLLRDEAEDTRAFCVEKNSMAPEVEVVGDEALRVPLLADSYVEYICAEVLKNGMHALIAKWGAWDVDEAEPIRVELAVHPGPVPPEYSSTNGGSTSENTTIGSSAGDCSTSGSSSSAQPGHFSVTITDTGGGMTEAQIAKGNNFFMTSHKPHDPHDVHYGYGYSRDHGAQFQGLGVGMPLSRAYARFLGGHVTWTGDRRAGTTRVRLVLPLDGFHF